MYDFLLTTGTYFSVDKSLNLAKSLHHLPGRNLIIFTSCRKDDADALAKELKKLDIECAVFFSDINNSRFCINYGFVFSVMSGLKSKWYVSCDDDIEFYEAAKDIPIRLERMKEMGFCIGGFCNQIQQYGGLKACNPEGYQIAPGWLDGNAMFMDYEDVLKYGLTDSLIDEPITFFVEVELEHRWRVLTGKPLVVDLQKVYYRHRFRDDPVMADMRNWNQVRGIEGGSRLWIQKYGIKPMDWNTKGCHQYLFDHVSKENQRANMKRHLMYNNLWTDNWPAIVRYCNDKVRTIYENIRWD